MTRRDHETYLGDGVYYSFDGYQHWLQASDGVSIQHAIALEPEVLQRLVAHVKQVYKAEHAQKKLQR